MKNFENKNNGKFDNDWQSAFENAEIQPSSSLWEKIDHQLTKQENSRFRKRLFFYRLVAGISLIALAGLGVYSLNLFQDQNSDSIAGQQNANISREGGQFNDSGNPGKTSQEGGFADSTSNPSSTANNTALANAGLQKSNLKNLKVANKDNVMNSGDPNDQSSLITTGSLPEIPEKITSQNVQSYPAFEKVPKVNITIYKVPDYSFEKEPENKVKFLAGINISPNFFSPKYSSKSSNAPAALTTSYFSDNYDVNDLETYLHQKTLETSAFGSKEPKSPSPITYGMENTPKLSASYGIDLGIKLGKKWTLNSGLNYKQLVATTTTSAIWTQTGSSEKIPLTVNNEKEFFNREDGNIDISRHQTLNNAFDFVNIPINLGYRFNFNPLSLEISSGIGANFLVANSLSSSERNNELREVNLHPGENTPFRSIYLNSQVSGSINYNFLSNYYLSLTPYYNLSITSFTKQESNFNSYPMYYGLQFGLRYEF